ncbi:MAG: hypothetical protein L6R42_008964 [Xanthoria sp. 1 TBL-2021]|nr:MAG: hypothetical protein L6R42_008964 [Xanthoria sp. 1 TBL-2021]
MRATPTKINASAMAWTSSVRQMDLVASSRTLQTNTALSEIRRNSSNKAPSELNQPYLSDMACTNHTIEPSLSHQQKIRGIANGERA